MSIRARSRRRLLLLLLLVVAVVGGGGALYAHRARVLDREAREAREAGLAAFARGEHERATALLGRFLKRLEPDPVALLRYAQALLETSSEDPRYAGAAMTSLRRCVDLDPSNEEARRLLVRVFLDLGMGTETLGQAEWFLARDAGDRDALLARAQALMRMRRYAEALETLDRQVPPASPRLEEHLLHLTLMAQLKRPAEAVLSRAAAVEEAHATRPRYRLAGAHARLLLGSDLEAAHATLREVAPQVVGDVEFARIALPDLDGARLPREALALLEGLAPSQLDRPLQEELVRRLWEAGQGPRIAGQLAAWARELPRLSTRVLGYHALALARMGRAAEAEPALALLEGRAARESAEAAAWVAWLRGAEMAAAPGVRVRIEAGRAAVAKDPHNALLRYELGRAWQAAGEPELALRELGEAASLSRNWGAPAALAADVLMGAGRFADAVKAARSADSLDARDPGVRLLLALARSAARTGAGTSFPDRVLEELDQVGWPEEKALELRVGLLGAAGRLDEARRVLEEALASAPPPPAASLLALAALGRRLDPELAARLLRRCEASSGNTPELASALARARAAAQGPDAGLALLRERRASAPDREAAAWHVAEAGFLEAVGRGGQALEAWKAATKGEGLEPALLGRLLSGDLVWGERAFASRLVGLLREATGDAGLAWRAHAARLALADDHAGAPPLDEAIGRLESVVAEAPEHLQARRLLAEAYERRGRPQDALDQLRVVRGTVGRLGGLDLQIARLYQKAGRGAEAREELDRLVAARPSGSRHLLAIAALYARLGARAEVLEILDSLGDEDLEVEDAQRRAELYAAVGELERAERGIRAVLGREESPRAVLVAAALAERRGDRKEADALLGRLDALVPDARERGRLLAAHFRRVGRLGDAEARLRGLVGDAGAQPSDWIGLLALLLLEGKHEALLDVLARGEAAGALRTAEGEPLLRVDLLRAALADERLHRLGLAYVEDEANRAGAADALAVLANAEGDAPTEAAVAALRALGRDHPGFLDLQLVLADVLMRAGAPEEAAAVCQRAAERFPTDAEPVRLLAYCQRTLGRLDLAAAAARSWRGRSSGSTREPDLFLAALLPAQEAVNGLEPYVAGAVQDGDTEVLSAYGAALLRAGRGEQVEALLAPLLARRPAFLRVWIDLAREAADQGAAKTAATWLENEAVGDGSRLDADGRVVLAAAWHAVAAATGAEEHGARFRAALALASKDGDPSPGALETLGLLHQEVGDEVREEEAYRRALAEEPARIGAGNNLAMILARSGRAAEALPLAERVVARAGRTIRAPEDLAQLHDTLAFVLERSGDVPGALRQLGRCRELEPRNDEWARRVVEVQLAAGQGAAASESLARFRRLFPDERLDEAARKAWADLDRRLK